MSDKDKNKKSKDGCSDCDAGLAEGFALHLKSGHAKDLAQDIESDLEEGFAQHLNSDRVKDKARDIEADIEKSLTRHLESDPQELIERRKVFIREVHEEIRKEITHEFLGGDPSIDDREREPQPIAAHEDDPDLPVVQLMGVNFSEEECSSYDSGISLYPRGISWAPDYCSHAVYCADDARETVEKGQLKIWARFYCSMGRGKIQVRAIYQKVALIDVLAREIQDAYKGQDALGDVAPTTVFIDDSKHSVFRGKNTYVPLKLINPQFIHGGVRISDVIWKWQYRMVDREATEKEGKTVWQDQWYTIRVNSNRVSLKFTRGFHVSQHRVYTSLSRPNAPWTDKNFPDLGKKMPIEIPLWVKAVEKACIWAWGAKTKSEIAQKIADKLNQSGLFKYHPSPNYVQTKYQHKKGYSMLDFAEIEDGYIAYFHCKKLMERLWGGHGLGPEFNCFDCAMTVVALSNMLGCNLKIGKLQNAADLDATDNKHYEDNRFEINPILAIGHSPEKPESIPGVNVEDGDFFAYHTVAWEEPAPDELLFPGRVSNEDFANPACRIYDACVEFIIDGKRISGSGHLLGDTDSPGTYIDYLAADTALGKARCKPQPITVAGIQILA